MKVNQKRYQYWSRTGIVWTPWFDCDSDLRDPVQLKGFKGNHLKNEYRTIVRK
jgi:hypothetical protein